MDRRTWETLVTALQAWEEIDYNAANDYEFRTEQRACRDALAWLISVEPKEDN